MFPRRRWFGLALVAVGVVACGGAPTRLVTVKAGAGAGPVELEVKNLTDVPINNLYLAPSGQVTGELDPDSPEGEKVWGPDLLTGAIATGTRVPVPVPGPGRWDARALDRDGRYQHVAALKLDAGGRYILELNEGGWRVR
jgi:hypothetical protein